MMKTKILIAVLVSLLVILAVSPAIPAGNKPDEQGQDADKGPKAPPEIESITFIFYRYPTHAGPGPHPEEETDNYHFTRGRLHWSSFPVEYEIDPTGSPVTVGATIAAVEAGFEEWDVYDPVPPEVTGSEGFFNRVDSSSNTVSWGTIDGDGPAVAMASISYYPWSREIVGFKIVFDKDEKWDIYVDPVPTWPYTGEDAFDIQNVAAHEVGHVVGLDHVNAPKDGLLTMYRYTTEGETIKRDLGVGDQLGVVDLYD